MKVFVLENPLDRSIEVKFMSSISGLPLTSFPAMAKIELLADGVGDEPINILLFSPNYLKIGGEIFRVVCTVLGDEKEMYITQETGQIVDFVQKGFLEFINITQIQVISNKMGIALKN